MQTTSHIAEPFLGGARAYGAVPTTYGVDDPRTSRKQPRPRALCFSRDPMLGETRRKILQFQFDSVFVSSLGEVYRLDSAAPFHVIILCHSLFVAEREGCLAFAKRTWPRAKVVLVASESGPDEQGIDRKVVGTAGPEVLLCAVQQVLRPTASAMDKCSSEAATD